jgi:hypothetical protein
MSKWGQSGNTVKEIQRGNFSSGMRHSRVGGNPGSLACSY